MVRTKIQSEFIIFWRELFVWIVMYIHITLAGGIFHFLQFQQFFFEIFLLCLFSKREINDERECTDCLIHYN